MHIPKLITFLLFNFLAAAVFANFFGELTAVTLSNSTELAPATYTLQFSGVNDNNTGGSEAQVAQQHLMQIQFPPGTDVTNATVTFNLPPYSSPLSMTVLGQGNNVIQVYFPTDLPAQSDFRLVVSNVINPPINTNCTGGTTNTYPSALPCNDFIEVATQTITANMFNFYTPAPNVSYDITAAPTSLGSITVEKPMLLAAELGSTRQKMIRLRIESVGNLPPFLVLDDILFDLNGTDPNFVTQAQLWYDGNQDFLSSGAQLLATVPVGSPSIVMNNISLSLNPGDNYLWLTYDLAINECNIGQVLDGRFDGVIINGQNFTAPTPSGTRTIIPDVTNAMSNLVPNPGFETYTTCPSAIGDLELAAPWDDPNITAMLTPSVDLFNICAGNNTDAGVPSNRFGTQQPRNGDGYAGIFTFGAIGYKEYLQVPLTTPLTAGQTYQVTYWVNGAEEYVSSSSTFDLTGRCNGLGFMFGTAPEVLTTLSHSVPSNFIADYTEQEIAPECEDWVPISATYTAMGGESWLLIGQFLDGNPNPSPNYQVIGSAFNYYYIDDVSVVPLNIDCCPSPATPGFVTAPVLGPNNQGRRVYAFDVNDDGLDDIVTTNSSQQNGAGVLVRINLGAGVFGLPISYLAGISIESVDFLDVNGDMREDLICQGFNDAFVLTGDGLLNINIGTFSLLGSQNINTSGAIEYRSGFEMADFNGDNKEDLVVLDGNSDRIAIFFRNNNTTMPLYGNSGPDQILNTDAVISYWEAKAAHLNSDTFMDLYLSEGGGTNNVIVFMGTATGLDANPITIQTQSADWPRGIDFVDFDNNGNPDLVVASQYSEEILLTMNIDPNTLMPGTTLSPNWVQIPTPGYQPVGLEVADINADGFLDIAASLHYPGSRVRIFYNNGLQGFANQTTHSTAGFGTGSTTELAVANLTGECCPDIVTANWPGNGPGPGSSTVFLNTCVPAPISLAGTVFCEAIGNCVPNLRVPNEQVAVLDQTSGTTYYTQTDPNGNYSFQLPATSLFYDLTLSSGSYEPTCQSTIGYPYLNQITLSQTGLDFIAGDNCGINIELSGNLSGSNGAPNCPYTATPCPNLDWEYCVEFTNEDCQSVSVNEFVLNLPAGVISVNNLPQLTNCFFGFPSGMTAVVDNPSLPTKITWSNGGTFNMLPNQCVRACVEVTFGNGLNTTPTSTAEADYTCGGQNATDSAVLAYPDTCSCDPNWKSVYPLGCGTDNVVGIEPLTYRVQFFNIGQSQAFSVRIEDQLDADLDWSTFQLLTTSHTPTSTSIDANGNLIVDFQGINLAPQTGGWIQYELTPQATITSPVQVTNEAAIIFDNNAPVVTNTVSNWVAPVPLSGTLSPSCTQVYYGYDPLSCATLVANGVGGIAPYAYSWSSGQSGSSIQVCPTQTTVYSVTITDSAGCSTTLSTTVHVTDVVCGNNNNKVRICHIPPNNPNNRVDKCIKVNKVAQHLAHGDFLGFCDEIDPCDGGLLAPPTNPDAVLGTENFFTPSLNSSTIQVYPNPTAGQLQIILPKRPLACLEIRDLSGRIVAQFGADDITSKFELDTKSWIPGIYLILATYADDGETMVERVIKQ